MDKITTKLIVIGSIAVACTIASVLVLGLSEEREARREEARASVRDAWGAPQTLIGPLLTFTTAPAQPQTPTETYYLLPATLAVESTLEPEVRTRGIFSTVVYTERLSVHGTFLPSDVQALMNTRGMLAPVLSVDLSDTRSIETQASVSWNDTNIAFAPGAQSKLLEGSGMHASVPFDTALDEYRFAFELTVRGSEEVSFVPLGKETTVTAQSSWSSPEFTGAFLPTERTVSDAGFTSLWRVSSFGRNYPQAWKEDGSVSLATLSASAFGVQLNEGVDVYTQVSRSAKYAILFIVITFAAFFLFETLSRTRIHPVQYVLLGAALALFYLLLLSLAEHTGFLIAYLAATGMTVLLITLYSASVLQARHRAATIGGLLLVLYGYLYFVLQLEEQALLFGSLLLFALLALTMYLTRGVDWFAVQDKSVEP